MHPQHDPQAAFHEWFAALVEESGLSIREIEKSTGVGKSTIDAWKNSKALPHSGRDLTKVVRVLLAAAGRNSDDQRLAREWSDLLGKAKEARDARSRPVPRQSGGQAAGNALDSERRARTIAATTEAMEAFSRLRHLGTMPDWEHERRSRTSGDVPELTADQQAAADEWEERRDDLLREAHLATLDIGDAELRARLEQAARIIRLWNGPMSYARQSENRTRFLATDDALEALGAFRRGDQLPEQSAKYRNTIEYADLYLEELEMNPGY